jgi:hypothetical protein
MGVLAGPRSAPREPTSQCSEDRAAAGTCGPRSNPCCAEKRANGTGLSPARPEPVLSPAKDRPRAPSAAVSKGERGIRPAGAAVLCGRMPGPSMEASRRVTAAPVRARLGGPAPTPRNRRCQDPGQESVHQTGVRFLSLNAEKRCATGQGGLYWIQTEHRRPVYPRSGLAMGWRTGAPNAHFTLSQGGSACAAIGLLYGCSVFRPFLPSFLPS